MSRKVGRNMNYKTCTKCKREFPATVEFFHVRSDAFDSLAFQCKKCKKVADKKYQEDNKIIIQKQRRLYYEINKKEISECNKKYGKTEKGKNVHKKARHIWYLKNKEKKLLQEKQWRLKNLGICADYTAKYRASKLQATPAWADMDAIKLHYIWCDIFNMMFKPYIKFEVDHIIPLQGKNVCGLHVENNLQILPAMQNRQKNNSFNMEGYNGFYKNG